MNRQLCVAAFGVGLAAVAWVGFGYLGTNALALTMTALIGAFYLMGALELWRFQQATASLSTALAALPDPRPDQQPNLGAWLARIHPSLQNPVRLRIEGERVGLPGPSMTPYLVGLLVLLGMLGTFLGMVVTLNGAVMALESTTDLATIRAALAAPVKGLGLAFGTSVAGVAASAMLGLVSALCRRERLQAAQWLDTRSATTLRVFSLAHQRQETLAALQLQARVMPEVVGQMQALMAQVERRSEGLNERLLASQERFYSHSQSAFADLAAAVDLSLKETLTESARAASATIQPVVEATMASIARDTAVFQGQVADKVQQHLDGLAVGLQGSLGSVTQVFEQGTASLLLKVNQAHAALQAETAAADQQRLAAWTMPLESMARTLQHEWQQAGAQTLAQQQEICKTLEQTSRDMHAQAESHARTTIAEMSRLIDAAAEAPRAAAEVVSLLRQKLSDSMARDNDLLDERSRIMGTLNTLLDAINRAATEQRESIDALVSSSTAMLQQANAQFIDKIDADSAKMAAAAAQISGGAAEVASLGEAFGAGVQLFSNSNEALVAQLQRIEGALDKSTARSDEQLAYYVAQAREIIDLSISSQKQIVEDLQQLAIRRAPVAREAA